MTNHNGTIPSDQSQRDAIRKRLDVNMVVLASAGSGKTKSLIDRMIALIETGTASVEELVAITFTKKAAGELRTRFVEQLANELETSSGTNQGRLQDALARYDQCYLGTIHSFCAQLLRERPFAAGVTPNFRELDEREELNLREESWYQFMDTVAREEPDRLDSIFRLRLGPGDLFGAFGLRNEYADLPLKTGGSAHAPDLASSLPVLRSFVEHLETVLRSDADRGNLAVKLLLRTKRILTAPLDDVDIARLLSEWTRIVRWLRKDDWNVGTLKSFKETWQSELLDYIEPFLRQWHEWVYSQLAPLLDDGMEFYSERRRSLGVMSFDDLLLRAAEMLSSNKSAAEHFASKYKFLLVDEFQDTDPIQAQIALAITATEWHSDWMALEPRPGSLFIVGDDKQSIYRFRRADLQVFKQTADLIDRTGGMTVRLTESFRTTKSLTRFINETFDPLFSASETQATAAPLTAHYDDLIQEGPVFRITVPRNGGAEHEAERVAGFIRASLQGATFLGSCTPEDFLILARTNQHLGFFAKALEENRIPVDLTGGERLAESADLAYVVSILHAVARPGNPVPLLQVLRGPLFSVSDEELASCLRSKNAELDYRQPISDDLPIEVRNRFQNAFDTIRAFERSLVLNQPGRALHEIVVESGLLAATSALSQGDSRAGTLVRYLNFVRELESKGLDWIQILKETQNLIDRKEKRFYKGSLSATSGDAVRIMNVHQAKGLEARVVFLVDARSRSYTGIDSHFFRSADDAYFSMPIKVHSIIRGQPPGWNEDAELEKQLQREEESRLVYVAATRAKELLIVAIPEKGTSGPWRELIPRLRATEELKIFDVDHVERESGDAERPEQIVKTNQQRHQQSLRPSYLIESPSAAIDTDHHDNRHGRGTDYGSLVHDLMERLVLDPETDLAVTATRLGRVLGLSRADIDAAMDAVEQIRQSDFWGEVELAEAAYAEVPVGHMKQRGKPDVITRGVIDLVYRNANGWHIIDYKTHMVETVQDEDEIAHRYQSQLKEYAELWTEATGQTVASASVLLTETGSRVDVLRSGQNV